MGDITLATQLFNEALELEGRSLGDAKALYEKVVEYNPFCAEAYVNLGMICYHDFNYRSAIQYFRKALEIRPNYALAHFDLANSLEGIGRKAKAITEYQRAIFLDPQYADAHYNLALAYEERKEFHKALPHWKQYAKLDSSGNSYCDYAKMRSEDIVSKSRLAIVRRNKNRKKHLGKGIGDAAQLTIVNKSRS